MAPVKENNIELKNLAGVKQQFDAIRAYITCTYRNFVFTNWHASRQILGTEAWRQTYEAWT